MNSGCPCKEGRAVAPKFEQLSYPVVVDIDDDDLIRRDTEGKDKQNGKDKQKSRIHPSGEKFGL